MNITVDHRGKLIFTALRRMVPLLIHVQPIMFGLILSLRLLASAIPAIQAWLLLKLTDSVVVYLDGGTIIYSVNWLLLTAASTFLSVCLDGLTQYVTLQFKIRVQYEMENQLANKATRVPLMLFEQPQYYDQLQRAKTNVSIRGFQLVELMLAIIQAVFTLIGFLFLLAQFSWLLVPALIVGTLPVLLIHMKIGEWKFWLLRFQSPYTRRLFYLFDLMTNKLAAKEMRIYQLSSSIMKEWKEQYWMHAGEEKKTERKAISSRSGSEGLSALLLLIFLVYAVWICFIKELTVGTFVAISQTLTTSQTQMKTIAMNVSQIYEESLIIHDFFSFMDLEEEKNLDGELFEGELRSGISVRNLTFRYPARANPVLKNVSFDLPANKTIAIVGDNGAGKSTLVNCLTGLFHDYDGEIYYDGKELKEFNLSSFRQHISAVFQDFMRYQTTVGENIGFGNTHKMNDRSSLEAAAAMSGADEVAAGLTDGYQTRLGTAFDGGIELSVGQWQKLALARAFFRESKIVVLDEPTASLDPLAESDLFTYFSKLSKGKTTFLVSHRLGSCRIADHILVMKNGELVEQGSHTELMSNNGEYKKMYDAQSKWYQQEKEQSLDSAFP